MASPSDPVRPRRALVTGLAGFTGHYVAAELRAAGYEVVGLGQTAGSVDGTSLPIDLCDREAILSFLEDQAFDAVVHLAAISFVAHGDADAIYRVNIVGTRNLLEGLAAATKQPRIIVLASSANVYGNVDAESIGEDVPACPANDYGVSKVAMEHMAHLWSDRLPITITRPFNYTGVGQGVQFLIPKIVEHYRAGEREIELGNIDVVRDFLDVRDVARIYRQLVEAAPVGEVVNLCSGVGHSLREVLDMVGRLAGYRIDVRVNPAFMRSREVKRLIGSAQRLQRLFGKQAPIPFVDTLAWMFRAP